MQAEGVNHIHAHYATHPTLVAWIIHQLTGIPYSITVHSHDIYFCKAMLSTKLRDAKFIVTISEYNRSYMKNAVGPWVSEKIHVIHCGITPQDYSKRINDSISDPFEIIHIGSLQLCKGQKYILEASLLLKQKNIPLHVKIIGMGVEHRNLVKLIEKYHLQDVVELCGPKTQEEVRKLLPEGHCYIQPSLSEGLPVAIMEALACELPVVASAITGIPEIIQDNFSGYLIPAEDSYALANALQKIYLDYPHAIQMAQNGHQKVLDEFDLRKNVAQIGKLFEINNPPPANQR
jgi:glycosyltransferase involved in cell wall biosynthesis